MTWHLAQMNVGTVLYPLDDPAMAGFMGQLDAINALADAAPGFVWRLQSEQGNATDIVASDDPRFIVNMSVWESLEPLAAFAYRSAHRLVMAQRRQWFERPAGAYQVLWWIEAGRLPAVAEGLERLRRLDTQGPSATAFDFRHPFPAPDLPATDLATEPTCIGWR